MKLKIFISISVCAFLGVRFSSTAQSAPAHPLKGQGTQSYIPIWSGPNTLDDSSMFQSGHDVGVGTATLLKSSTGIATTFDCEAYSNLNACLDAAEAYTTTNEVGAGHAARVLLGDGVYSLAAPYEITSGITLI